MRMSAPVVSILNNRDGLSDDNISTIYSDPHGVLWLTTITGKIVKDGDKFVLTDADGKLTYQLDDQKKAKSFLNKNVKVNGVLDNSSGVIRVNAIEPAA
jgi:hypothetical protein